MKWDKWNMEDILRKVAMEREEKALNDMMNGDVGRSETMDRLLVVDCLKNGWTVEDFFLKFNESDIVDPWEIKREVECLKTTWQIRQMFEEYQKERAA